MNLRVVGHPTLDGLPRHWRVVDLHAEGDEHRLRPCEAALCHCGRVLGHDHPCQ